MDAFKFAFETTIVGLLALPWLALLISIFLQPFHANKLGQDGLLSKILEPTPLSILTFALAYFLGSAVSPLATQLLDDQDLPTLKIREIRADLYLWYFDWLSADRSLKGPDAALSLAAADLLKYLPAPNREDTVRKSPPRSWAHADTLFLLQEQVVLREGTDKTERISRLHEQVIVLRGAVFNGFVFAVLCCFAWLARPRGEPLGTLLAGPKIVFKTLGTILVSGGLIFVAVYLGKIDLLHHDVTDPPIMECGLLFLGLTGLFTIWKGVTKRPYTFAALVFGLIFTALASGAWAWTEVLYSQNVMAAYFSAH